MLYLIEKNKVDIYNIPIVDIADQFNAYVADIDTFDVDYASKFFVMAATLLQIKSRLLLPKQPKTVDDEEDPQEVLVRQLVEYKKMKALSQAMGSLWDARSLMMGRLPAPMPYEVRFEGHIDTKALYEAFRQVCKSLTEPEAVEIRIQKEIYSVGECMRRVTYALRRAKGTMTAAAIFQACRSRVELVVTFLAVLELLKVGQCVTVAEGKDGNTIALRYTPKG